MKTNTQNFWTPQSFGAASEVRQISVEEYLRDHDTIPVLNHEGTGG